MIIETSSNRFYSVRETGDANLSHVWYGVEMKFNKRLGQWVVARRGEELVRKAATRVVEG